MPPFSPPPQSKTRKNSIVDHFFAASTDPADAASQQLLHYVRDVVRNQTDFLVSTRRTLHQRPELMFNEKETSAVVQHVLQQLDIPYTTGWSVNTNPHVYPGPGGYGVVADIGTGQAPCVLLRADMDALPIFERTENIEAFKSKNDNRMHACGHDGHTTMLLGAAAVLKSIESSIPGTGRETQKSERGEC